MSNLLPCPKCGCPDELTLDSSSAAEASWIECGWCEHRMQRRCDEETLAEKWNALSRKKMPEFNLDAELAKLDKPQSQHRCEQCARQREIRWFWYWEAKKAQRALAQQPAAVDGALVRELRGHEVERLLRKYAAQHDKTSPRMAQMMELGARAAAALAAQQGGES